MEPDKRPTVSLELHDLRIVFIRQVLAVEEHDGLVVAREHSVYVLDQIPVKRSPRPVELAHLLKVQPRAWVPAVLALLFAVGQIELALHA